MTLHNPSQPTFPLITSYQPSLPINQPILSTLSPCLSSHCRSFASPHACPRLHPPPDRPPLHVRRGRGAGDDWTRPHRALHHQRPPGPAVQGSRSGFSGCAGQQPPPRDAPTARARARGGGHRGWVQSAAESQGVSEVLGPGVHRKPLILFLLRPHPRPPRPPRGRVKPPIGRTPIRHGQCQCVLSRGG